MSRYGNQTGFNCEGISRCGITRIDHEAGNPNQESIQQQIHSPVRGILSTHHRFACLSRSIFQRSHRRRFYYPSLCKNASNDRHMGLPARTNRQCGDLAIANHPALLCRIVSRTDRQFSHLAIHVRLGGDHCITFRTVIAFVRRENLRVSCLERADIQSASHLDPRA